MSEEKTSDPKTASPDDLTQTTNKDSVELTEEQLDKTSGGVETYLKVKLTDVIISG